MLFKRTKAKSKKNRKKDSRAMGLELAAICGKHLLKSQNLHFGYWPSDLEVHIINLRRAHENYDNFLMSHIPPGTKTILDVGCGTGATSKKLVDKGYQVDCVSPSRFLTEEVRELLSSTSHIFECSYEQLQTEKRYDVILFSESFQYIHLPEALDKTLELLNSDGYCLVCDVFKKDVEGKSLIGGGHRLTEVYDFFGRYPFEIVKDIDITEQTARTVDMLSDVLNNVVRPSLDLGFDLLNRRYPLAHKFLRWKYRKRINKIYDKYLDGQGISESFRTHKSYRLLLCRKTDPGNAR